MGRAILFGLWVAVTLYALIDCIRTPKDLMPAKLPKTLWLLLILLITPIGSIAWIIVSRVAAAEDKGGRFEPTVWSSRDSVPLYFGREKVETAPQTPDDDPEFLESLEQRIRDKQREEYQRKQREAEEKQQPDASKPRQENRQENPSSKGSDSSKPDSRNHPGKSKSDDSGNSGSV